MEAEWCFKINTPKVIYEVYENEAVIINLDTGSYYSLGFSGLDIWNAIERGVTVGNIGEAMVSRYDGMGHEIQAAVHQLLGDLQKEELIVPAEANGAPAVEAHVPAADKPRFQAPTLNKYSDMQDLLLLDPIHDVDETGWPGKAPSHRPNG